LAYGYRNANGRHACGYRNADRRHANAQRIALTG
jgi:hypothetical protein